MQSLSALAAALSHFLSEESIEHCVAGDLSEPDARAVGFDIIVAEAALARIPLVLKTFCGRNGTELVQYRRGPDGLRSFMLCSLSHEQHPEFITLNIRSDYLRCGRAIFTARQMLDERICVTDVAGQGRGHFVAAPAQQFICQLFRCLDRGDVSERDGRHLSEQWREDAAGALQQVERFWNAEREGGVIARAAVSAHWEPVRASVHALRSALGLRNVLSPMAWLREQFRRLAAWLRPSGLMIACLGPEGSGKGNVIRALTEHPLATFPHVHSMALRPGLMRPATVSDKDTPPRPREPRGNLAIVAKLLMFVADYWLGYWLQIRPKLVRSTLVVSNRYYDDMLVNPRRYRMDRPRILTRVLLPWIPRPELWLVFDIPSELLQTRQKEAVADEEAARQRGEYRRVLRPREDVVVLDASSPLEEVVAQAERAIVMQLARRTARQLRLPVDTVSNPVTTDVLLFFCRRNVPMLSRLVRVVFNSDIHCRLPVDLHLPHPYGIVIHPQAVIGRGVTLMQQVTIGGKDRTEKIAPIIGDDVYIGAGARVLGDVRIGNGVVVGANAVVTRDIPPGVTVVGANRIVANARGTGTNVDTSDPSIAQFPVGAQRSFRHH